MEMSEEEDKEKLEEKLKQFEDDLTTYGNFDFFLTFYFFVLFVQIYQYIQSSKRTEALRWKMALIFYYNIKAL